MKTRLAEPEDKIWAWRWRQD